MRRSLLLGLGLTALLGCDAAELDEQSSTTETRDDALFYDLLATPKLVNCGGKTYTATMLTNNWMVTSAACLPDTSTPIEMPYEPIRYLDETATSPAIGYTLVHVANPYRIMNTTTDYQLPFYMGQLSELIGQKVTCTAGGSSTTVQVSVTTATTTRIGFSATKNLPFTGDQGAFCYRLGVRGPEYIGPVVTVNQTKGEARAFSGASSTLTTYRRNILGRVYLQQSLVCHGPECFTRGTAVPDNTVEQRVWQPCSETNVRVPGRFTWTASYDFEAGKDYLVLNGVPRTGSSTGDGGDEHQDEDGSLDLDVGISTNQSNPSPGLRSLVAQCANVRINATGFVDQYSYVETSAAWSSGQGGAGDGCATARTADAAQLGCGMVVGGTSTTNVTLKCHSEPPSTRKVKSVTVSRPYQTSRVYDCGSRAECAVDVPFEQGLTASCAFVQ